MSYILEDHSGKCMENKLKRMKDRCLPGRTLQSLWLRYDCGFDQGEKNAGDEKGDFRCVGPETLAI